MYKKLYCFLTVFLIFLGKSQSVDALAPKDNNIDDHWHLNIPQDWAIGYFEFLYPFSLGIKWEEDFGDRIGIGINAENDSETFLIFYSWLDGGIIGEGGNWGGTSMVYYPFDGFFDSISKMKQIQFDYQWTNPPYNFSLSGRCIHKTLGKGSWRLTFTEHTRQQHCHILLIVCFGDEDPTLSFQQAESFLIKE